MKRRLSKFQHPALINRELQSPEDVAARIEWEKEYGPRVIHRLAVKELMGMQDSISRLATMAFFKREITGQYAKFLQDRWDRQLACFKSDLEFIKNETPDVDYSRLDDCLAKGDFEGVSGAMITLYRDWLHC